jgi:hypothetical protein
MLEVAHELVDNKPANTNAIINKNSFFIIFNPI